MSEPRPSGYLKESLTEDEVKRAEQLGITIRQHIENLRQTPAVQSNDITDPLNRIAGSLSGLLIEKLNYVERTLAHALEIAHDPELDVFSGEVLPLHLARRFPDLARKDTLSFGEIAKAMIDEKKDYQGERITWEVTIEDIGNAYRQIRDGYINQTVGFRLTEIEERLAE